MTDHAYDDTDRFGILDAYEALSRLGDDAPMGDEIDRILSLNPSTSTVLALATHPQLSGRGLTLLVNRVARPWVGDDLTFTSQLSVALVSNIATPDEKVRSVFRAVANHEINADEHARWFIHEAMYRAMQMVPDCLTVLTAEEQSRLIVHAATR